MGVNRGTLSKVKDLCKDYGWLILLLYTSAGYGFKTPQSQFNDLHAETRNLNARFLADSIHTEVVNAVQDKARLEIVSNMRPLLVGLCLEYKNERDRALLQIRCDTLGIR
jgi:hypothetical protein